MNIENTVIVTSIRRALEVSDIFIEDSFVYGIGRELAEAIRFYEGVNYNDKTMTLLIANELHDRFIEMTLNPYKESADGDVFAYDIILKELEPDEFLDRVGDLQKSKKHIVVDGFGKERRKNN